MAVANVTEKSNVNTLAYILGRQIAPSFQKKVVMMAHMYSEDVPADTNVVRLEKEGSLTATSHTEATAFSIGTEGELTDTYVDLTAVAIAVASARSLHARRFGGKRVSLERFLALQGAAIGRYVDNDALSLATSISNTVTSAAGMTFEDLYLGQYNIFNSECPDQDIPLVFVGAPRAMSHLKIQATQAGGAAFSNDVVLGIFRDSGGKPAMNGVIGQIAPGIVGVQTTGFQTSGNDNCQLLIHPKWALAGIFDTNIIVKNVEKITEGFYDEVGSAFFYDVGIYNNAAGVQMKSDS